MALTTRQQGVSFGATANETDIDSRSSEIELGQGNQPDNGPNIYAGEKQVFEIVVNSPFTSPQKAVNLKTQTVTYIQPLSTRQISTLYGDLILGSSTGRPPRITGQTTSEIEINGSTAFPPERVASFNLKFAIGLAVITTLAILAISRNVISFWMAFPFLALAAIFGAISLILWWEFKS